MAQKQWYTIYLETSETTLGQKAEKQVIAKIKSKGLAYGTLKFYKENVYTRPTDKLTIE